MNRAWSYDHSSYAANVKAKLIEVFVPILAILWVLKVVVMLTTAGYHSSGLRNFPSALFASSFEKFFIVHIHH
jgi:hypothetical protein